jgi:hypothetical protein
VLNSRPKGAKFNQDYLITMVRPGLYNEKTRTSKRKGTPNFLVQMDDSMGHNRVTITEKLEKKHIA